MEALHTHHQVAAVHTPAEEAAAHPAAAVHTEDSAHSHLAEVVVRTAAVVHIEVAAHIAVGRQEVHRNPEVLRILVAGVHRIPAVGVHRSLADHLVKHHHLVGMSGLRLLSRRMGRWSRGGA